MILKSLMNYINGLKQSLDSANTCRDQAEQAMKDAQYAIYKNSLGMDEVKKEVDNLNKKVEKYQPLFEKAWSENPGLRERYEKILEEHDESSRRCDEYREKANEAFADGNISKSKVFRGISIEKKDVCKRLQLEIAEIKEYLRNNYNIEKSYISYVSDFNELRAKKEELHKWETLELGLKADANKANKIYNVLKSNARACWEQYGDAWHRYYEIAMELADIPEEMRDGAKVFYKPEENQTMILFGEQDPETGRHGHAQLDNTNDKIIYYRPPYGSHGARNYTGKYQYHS